MIFTHLRTMAFCTLFAALTAPPSLLAQCSGSCTYWPDPGKFKVVGTTEVGPNGYPLIRVDQDGTILDDLNVEFVNTKTPSCEIDPEDVTTSYGGGVGCELDQSEIGDGLSFSWSVEFGDPVEGFVRGFGLTATNYQSSTGESILLRRTQYGVFSAGSGVYSVVRGFSSRFCTQENDCPGREASVKIDVEKVFTDEANTKICFNFAADLDASATAAANQAYMAGIGADACGWHGGLSGEGGLPPTQQIDLCEAGSALPSRIVVYGTNEYCDLQDSRFEKLGTDDSDWVEIAQSEELSLSSDLIPDPGKSVLIRSRALRNGIWSTSNTLAIVVARATPEVTVTPAFQSLCIVSPAAPFSLSNPVQTDLPVTFQWQRDDEGTWRNISGATSSSLTPTTNNTTTYRLRVKLDPQDPLSSCFSTLYSDTVTLQRNDDATVYARDADGDGFPATDASGEIRILCEPEDGWVYAGLHVDCDDTDPAVHPENVWFEDSDGDGSPDLDDRTLSCTAPTPTSVRSTDVANWADDCNDSDPNVFQESLWYADRDGDGYASFPAVSACNDPGPEYKRLEELAGGAADCDDTDPAWNPQTVWYRDEDADGYGNPDDTVTGCSAPEGYFRESALVAIDDCDDTDDRYGFRERYYVDVDGDGYPALNAGGDVRGRVRCGPNNTFTKAADELVSVELGDCDDADPDVHPGVLWYPDRDGDGLGDSFTEFGNGFAACEKPHELAVRNRRDCDDYDPADKCHVSASSRLALNLTGASTAAEVTRKLGSFGTDDFTVELWIRTENPDPQVLFSKGLDVEEYARWLVGTREGRLYAEILLTDGQALSVTGVTEVADGQWHHVIFRRTGQRFVLFADGDLEAEEQSSTDFDLSARRNLWVSDETLPSFVGDLDEVRFWNVGRTLREIELSMHRTLDVDDPGLVAYWQMEELVDGVYPEGAVLPTVVDIVGGMHLTILSAELVESRTPVGDATSAYSEYAPGVTEGDALEFEGVAFGVQNPEIEGEGVSAVATEISELPHEADPLPGEAAAQAHYVLSLLQVGAQEVAGNAAVGVGQGQGAGAGVPEYTLYRRPRNGDGPWEAIASTQEVVEGSAIFADVRLVTAQYFVKFELVEPAGTPFRRGDSDGSGILEITDAVNTLTFLFLGGEAPLCMDAADVDDNATLDLSDPVSLLNYLFLGGSSLPVPGADACGLDPVGETLGCDTYENC